MSHGQGLPENGPPVATWGPCVGAMACRGCRPRQGKGAGVLQRTRKGWRPLRYEQEKQRGRLVGAAREDRGEEMTPCRPITRWIREPLTGPAGGLF